MIPWPSRRKVNHRKRHETPWPQACFSLRALRRVRGGLPARPRDSVVVAGSPDFAIPRTPLGARSQRRVGPIKSGDAVMKRARASKSCGWGVGPGWVGPFPQVRGSMSRRCGLRMTTDSTRRKVAAVHPSTQADGPGVSSTRPALTIIRRLGGFRWLRKHISRRHGTPKRAQLGGETLCRLSPKWSRPIEATARMTANIKSWEELEGHIKRRNPDAPADTLNAAKHVWQQYEVKVLGKTD